MELTAFGNVSFKIQICLFYPPEYFQLGHVYYVPSLHKYRKIMQTFSSVIISLPVK